MFRYGKIFFRTMKTQDAGNPKIPIILFIMTPAYQVPTEGVEYQSDGFQFPYRNFLLLICLSDLKDFLRCDCLLNSREVVKTLYETYRYLKFNIGSQLFYRIFLG
jgi:hypothetical protein